MPVVTARQIAATPRHIHSQGLLVATTSEGQAAGQVGGGSRRRPGFVFLRRADQGERQRGLGVGLLGEHGGAVSLERTDTVEHRDRRAEARDRPLAIP